MLEALSSSVKALRISGKAQIQMAWEQLNCASDNLPTASTSTSGSGLAKLKLIKVKKITSISINYHASYWAKIAGRQQVPL